MQIYPYRTTVSETGFSADPPDPYSSLENYRCSDQVVIEGFIEDGKEQVMIVGGISGAGKTHLVREKLVREDRPLIELGQLSEADLRQLATRQNISTVFLDEGVYILEDSNEHLIGQLAELIIQLIERRVKVVLIGGGRGYTGTEQTDLLSRYVITASATRVTHDFKLKTLSLQQTTELIMQLTGFDEALARAIATTILEEHRIPAIVKGLRIHHPDHWFDHPESPYSLILNPDIRRQFANEQRQRFRNLRHVDLSH